MSGRNNTVHWSEETHPYIASSNSLQCYIAKFSSTTMLWKSTLGSKYIFEYGKSKHNKYIIYEFLHMVALGKTPEWESAMTLGQHTLSSSRTTLQLHGHRHSTHYTFFICRVNRRYRFNMDTVFTYRSLCYGYRITYTSRFGNFCSYFFWCQPARLVCWPLQPGTVQYTTVDDDVEAAPIYRYDGKISQPIKPHENHGLHIKHIPTWMESWCKQQMQPLVVPA